MKKLFSVIVLTFLIVSTSYGDNDKKYKDAVTKMFELSGSQETFKVAINQMFTMFKQKNSNIPGEFWEELEKEFLDTSLDSLVDMLIPIYKKHLTIKDIKKLTKFYKSRVGQKFAEKTPLITKESMQVGQEWGQVIGERIAQKLLNFKIE